MNIAKWKILFFLLDSIIYYPYLNIPNIIKYACTFKNLLHKDKIFLIHNFEHFPYSFSPFLFFSFSINLSIYLNIFNNYLSFSLFQFISNSLNYYTLGRRNDFVHNREFTSKKKKRDEKKKRVTDL